MYYVKAETVSYPSASIASTIDMSPDLAIFPLS